MFLGNVSRRGASAYGVACKPARAQGRDGPREDLDARAAFFMSGGFARRIFFECREADLRRLLPRQHSFAARAASALLAISVKTPTRSPGW
jgi:hypothetical protein